MILALALAGILIGPLVLLTLLIYGASLRARQMELLAANLQGQLKQSEDKAEGYRQLAERAINQAAEKVKLAPGQVWKQTSPPAAGKPYVPPLVANCTRCAVSVRYPPEAFPVPCPACGNLIDPVLDNPPDLA